ncbi:DUF4843 domain-containing protein [Cytophagaceae bacterium SJW1-29]|uniref:DUF4843 domain-containing protein n=2 Tax=Salmonirosea aquatica TaxID=2654236 RepID=A0A7C9BCJ0_9BACT|nr:DUF4843 domain-containing protein [Cytophagaceae bacterium SJW1-29]
MHKFLSLGFVLALVALASCEEQKILFEGPEFVRFTDTTLTYKESIGQPITVSVHVVGKPLNQALTVNYTVGGTAREGRDYSIEGTKGVVVIPAGKLFGNITVNLINNANNILESQSIVFTLTDVTPSTDLQLGFGKNNVIGKTLTLTIQDDCLLSGFYTGSRQTSNGVEQVKDIEISSLDPNCKTYNVANWNVGGLFNFNATKARISFVDNGDNTLTIPAQVSDDLAAPYDTLRGNGLWNPQTKAITLNIKVKVPYSETKDTVITVPLTYTPR